MNNRIKELAKQAYQWAVTESKGGQNVCAPGSDYFLAMEKKKFAELIVQECASICELNGQSYTHSFTPAKARLAESTSNHCGLMIKKHFGVEE